MATLDHSRTTVSVRKQYERLPYPPRNPADEHKRLLATALDDLGSLNFYCYGGKRNYRQGFRALVAGGGTGDAVIFLAHQLQECDAEIVYLDLSDASGEIARQRAAQRGLEQNIRWINGSLLDLPQMGLPAFDYINCCGVLHHLEDPSAGLTALTSALKPDGAMGLMLYGQYGRTGVTQLQELLKSAVPDRADSLQAIEQTRQLLADLPESHWFCRGADLFNSLKHATHETLYDMFLHSQETGFTIPRLYQLLDTQGLHLAQFTIGDRILYETQFMNQNPNLKRAVDSLPVRERQAIAELYWGTITTHAFWATPRPPQPVDLHDGNQVPFFSRVGEILGVRESILKSDSGGWLFEIPGKKFASAEIHLEVTPIVRQFVESIDADRTLGEIAETIKMDSHSTDSVEQIRKKCSDAIQALLHYDLLLLRDSSVPPIRTW